MIFIPRFLKHEVISKILESGLLPVFYHENAETVKQIVRACAEGGAKAVEFTNRGDLAYQVFSEVSKWCSSDQPDAIFGAGTVVDAPTAALFINSGANFIVGPFFNPEVAEICNLRKVPYIPGCSTPSEISRAEGMGAEIVKVFPQRVLGADFLKLMRGPCPRSKLMPSGGIKTTREDFFALIKAGADALNIGTELIRKDLVKAGDFEGIRKNVEQCILWIKEARGDPLFVGVEHVGLYPNGGIKGEDIANWYAETFGFTKTEGRTSYFISGAGAGRIEVKKEPEEGTRCHVAVLVSDFERACGYLQEKGIELEEPTIKKDVKSVFLKKTDPAGNRVHIIYKI